jgi:hypothetical protein
VVVVVRVELVEGLLDTRVVGVVADGRPHLYSADEVTVWSDVVEAAVSHRDADGSANRNARQGDAN